MGDDIVVTDTETNTYKLEKYLEVNAQMPESSIEHWNNEETGATFEKNGYGYAYTTPTDVPCDLFTWYFKVKDGRTVDIGIKH